jgi:hypothetical protein
MDIRVMPIDSPAALNPNAASQGNRMGIVSWGVVLTTRILLLVV